MMYEISDAKSHKYLSISYHIDNKLIDVFFYALKY